MDVPTKDRGERRVPSHLDSADHWRRLAEEARTVAAQLTSQDARQVLLNIAEAYERLAAHAEAREKKSD